MTEPSDRARRFIEGGGSAAWGTFRAEVEEMRQLLKELVEENEGLRDALDRTLGNFENLLAGRPVRDATETIAEARAALGTKENK